MSEARELGGDSSELEIGPEKEGAPLALLSINVGSAEEEGFESRLHALTELLAARGRDPRVPPHLRGDDAVVGYLDVVQAADIANAVQQRFRGLSQLRIAGHYGMVGTVLDPFVGCRRPSRSGGAILRAVAKAAPPDTACVSLDFAAALAAESEVASCANWIGELHAFDGGTPISLYALPPPRSDD